MSEQQFLCPRGCGSLRPNRWQKYRHYHCKKCKGVKLDVDEIQAMGFGSKKLKKNTLENILHRGTPCSLNCPNCTRNMVEIALTYDEKRVKELIRSPSLLHLPMLIPGVDIVYGPIILLYAASLDVLGKKNVKTVTIDGCQYCSTFWFDKDELQLLTMYKTHK
jgi:Zn-finger nucleic acid-binding protein|tara:strand:+ start:790 stop:1278 length:489 start_codon:yes stop_codon:yes gene_type:complete